MESVREGTYRWVNVGEEAAYLEAGWVITGRRSSFHWDSYLMFTAEPDSGPHRKPPCEPSR